MNLDDIQKRLEKLNQNVEGVNSDVETWDKEVDKIIETTTVLEIQAEGTLTVMDNSIDELKDSVNTFSPTLEEIDKRFKKYTKLRKEDYIFVLFCAALQAYRQYLVTDFKPRLNAKDAEKKIKGNKKENSDRNKTRYYCSLEKIITTPVPFDTFKHFDHLSPGLSGNNHRWKCLGHYPILGYVFGTANIMTSTVTVKEDSLLGITTYHVSTETISCSGPIRQYSFNSDVISAKAHTDKMFEHIYERIRNNPVKGITALVAAIKKEHEHLRSDKNSTQSLPFPFLSFTPSIAENLHDYGLDYVNLATVGKQIGYSVIVNLITQILYLAYHAGKKKLSKSLNSDTNNDHTIKVRLNSILNVANVVATSTNLATVLVGLLTGNKTLMRKFDIGGEIVTLVQLSKSANYINEIQAEYVKQEINKFNNHNYEQFSK